MKRAAVSEEVTESPKKISKPRQTYGECNLWLLESQELCDVFFTIGHEKIGCHKLFLMSRSPVFKTMLAEKWDKNEKTEVKLLADCDPKYFKLFLKFIYADQFVSNVSDAIHLLALADKYEVPLLKQKCQALIETAISLEDSIAVYQGARRYNLPDLQKSAFEVMCENLDKLMKHPSFYQADEETLTSILQSDILRGTELEIFQGIMCWNSKMKSKPALKKLIPLIRFPVLTPEEFSRHVVPTKVLTDKEVVDVFTFLHAEPKVRGILVKSKFSTVPRGPPIDQKVNFYPGPQITAIQYIHVVTKRDFEDTISFMFVKDLPAALKTTPAIQTVKLRGPNPPPCTGNMTKPNVPTTEVTWKVTLTIRTGQDYNRVDTNAVVFQKSDIFISNMNDTSVFVRPAVRLSDATWYFISVTFDSDVAVCFPRGDEKLNPNNFCYLSENIDIPDFGYLEDCFQCRSKNGTFSSPKMGACVVRELGLSKN